MADATWNFPCWQWLDAGPGAPATGGSRNSTGTAFINSLTGNQAGDDPPFASEITIIGSFLISSEYTGRRGTANYLTSLGIVGTEYFYVRMLGGSSPRLEILIYDSVGATTRYDWKVLDDDGTTGKLITDKWYQFALSANGSGLEVVMNGETAPSITKTTTAPGSLNLDNGNVRMWHAALAGWGATTMLSVTAGWPAVVVGPMLLDSNYIDLTSATVRNRIFDTNGDLKNPGANGSLWLGDTYGANVPDFYFHDGSARINKGTSNILDGYQNQAAIRSQPGGFRKQWELTQTYATTLNTGLVAWWRLNEASGNRASAVGGYTLTDNNTVPGVTSTVDEDTPTRKASFTAANSEFLDRPSAEAAIWTPDGSFTISALVYPDSDHTGTIASVCGATGSEFSWRLRRVNGTPDRFEFQVTSTGDIADVVTVSESEAGPATGQFNHVVAYYDHANSKIGLIVNNNKLNSASFTGPVFDAAVPFCLGAIDPDGTPAEFWDGDLDEVCFFSRVLTRNEIHYLCNTDTIPRGRPYYAS